MDQRNDIDLRGAIPETPEMCRDAVLQAVSTPSEGFLAVAAPICFFFNQTNF